MVNKLIFLYFAAVILASAILMITRKNMVHSVMFLLLLFLHVAGLFALLNAEFLAAVQLLVYAGAILFLIFLVVMLLDVDRERSAVRAKKFWLWPAIFGMLIAGEIALLISRGASLAEAGKPMKVGTMGVRELGEVLYKQYLIPVEIASLLILVSLVGALILVKKSNNE